MEKQKQLSSEAKATVRGALITSMAAVLVAVIGVVPQLRNRQAAIDELTKTNDTLKVQLAGLGLPHSNSEQYTIHGNVTGVKHGLTYLAVPDEVSGIAPDGSFYFEHMSQRFYNLVLVDEGGVARVIVLNPDKQASRGDGFGITYEYRKEQP